MIFIFYDISICCNFRMTTQTKKLTNKINQNCPYFKYGNCNNVDCLYVHHKACYYKLDCDDINCKFGHICSYEKRLIAIEICMNYCVPNWKNVKYEDKCSYFMNCTAFGCGKQHVVEKKHRFNICKIISNENSDDEAKSLYNELYTDYNKEIAIASPALSSMSTISNNDIMSNKSVVSTPQSITPSNNKQPITMVDYLFKKEDDNTSSPSESPILINKNEIVPINQNKTDILKQMIQIEENINTTQNEISLLEKEIEEKIKILNIKKNEKETLKKQQKESLEIYQKQI